MAGFTHLPSVWGLRLRAAFLRAMPIRLEHGQNLSMPERRTTALNAMSWLVAIAIRGCSSKSCKEATSMNVVTPCCNLQH